MSELGKLLIYAGALLIVVGVLVRLIARLPGGMLPGDILIERKNFTFFFPVVTCIVVSVVLTLLLSFFGRK